MWEIEDFLAFQVVNSARQTKVSRIIESFPTGRPDTSHHAAWFPFEWRDRPRQAFCRFQKSFLVVNSLGRFDTIGASDFSGEWSRVHPGIAFPQTRRHHSSPYHYFHFRFAVLSGIAKLPLRHRSAISFGTASSLDISKPG